MERIRPKRPVAPAASRRFCTAFVVCTQWLDTVPAPIVGPLSKYPTALPRAHKIAGWQPALRMLICA